MKKFFTFALVLAMGLTGFAQTKGISHKSVKMEPAQMQVFTGLEDLNLQYAPTTRSIVEEEPIDLGQTYYDWQSNMGPRNCTAVWPDGFAAMAWTTSTTTGYDDRGTGIATFDPAVGEWTYSEGRVEPIKTGFGTIARYKQNGLVVAAHTADDLRMWINEDFRNGGTTWTEVALDNAGSHDACWPVVQCSGENLDIIHLLYTDNGATAPYTDPLLYARYANGAWEVTHEILPSLTVDKITDGGSNIAYFMNFDPEKPNRVAFILNNAWSDGKCVISEDNGATWSERVFYQHYDINGDFTDTWFFYPRWTGAAFDADDNLHIVYEYNGSTETAGSGSYYPAIGGIGYWSEVLPKNAMCLGGIGNVGEPFIMDTTYLQQDLYQSEWYWSDALHEPLPEYIGEIELLDAETHEVVARDYEGDWIRPESSNWSAHGKYNGGKAMFATMHYDKGSDRIFAFWSQICGDETTSTFFDGTNYYLRLFCNISFDGGQTWEGTKHVLTDFMTNFYEMSYDYVIPYVYTDAEGDYLWVCSQMDEEPGTYVQSDETVYDNNFYKAVKVYVNFMDVEENEMSYVENMNIFPNPAQGSFTIELENAANVNIYNAVGQIVKTYSNVETVSVSDLSAGVYFVQANNKTQKVVVK